MEPHLAYSCFWPLFPAIFNSIPVCVLVIQLCLTFCDPMDCSPPGSSVYGILQAKIVEWAAMPFSSYLPDPGIKHKSLALQADSLPPRQTPPLHNFNVYLNKDSLIIQV